MCGQTIMIYECPCGKISRETMPPRICTPKCETKRPQLTVNLIRPCKDCHIADPNIYEKLHRRTRECPTTQICDKPLPGIPEPGATDGLPPSYHHATEQPLTYAQAITEEEPASYENVMMAVATFQPEEIVRAWHTFRLSVEFVRRSVISIERKTSVSARKCSSGWLESSVLSTLVCSGARNILMLRRS